MFKPFLFGLLVGTIAIGSLWFFVGRNDIGAIRADLNRVNRDFEGVQRVSDKLTIDSAGFTRNIADITETSRRIESRSQRVEEGFAELDSGIGVSTGKVDELEQFNRSLIRIGRDIGDIASELRAISKEGGTEE